MELLSAHSLYYTNGSKNILADASFCVQSGKKYGLIGPNGGGKTTLLHLLTGEFEYDSGVLTHTDGFSFSLVPQIADRGHGESIAEYMLLPLRELKGRLAKLEEEMAHAEDSNLEKLLGSYQKVQEQYESRGGYTADERAENFLRKLGMDNSMDQTVDTLSGGEMSLLFFARALLGDPDLLILDEPGNHLDFLGLAWLEKFLREYSKAVLIVSHNRYMLDALCTEIWDLYEGNLALHTGNYSSYQSYRLKSLARQQQQFDSDSAECRSLEKRIQELQNITKNSYNPPKTVLVELNSLKGKLKRVRSAMAARPSLRNERIRWNLDIEQNSSDMALELINLSIEFPGKTLLKDTGLTIRSGEKVALIGANGTGKSCLLKRIVEEGSWDSATIRIGPSHRIAYVSQHPEFSDGARSIREEVKSWGPLSDDSAFSCVSPFLFSYKDLDKGLNILSGGEKNRLQLARVAYQKADFLILDEPTNHMDIKSREVIEKGLIAFPGTILLVSHDRYFLDRIAQRIVEISDHRLISHTGNFTHFFSSRYSFLPHISGALKHRGRDRKNTVSGINTSHEIGAIEKRIEEGETKKEKLIHDMEDALADHDSMRSRQLAAKLEKMERILEKLYGEWDTLL